MTIRLWEGAPLRFCMVSIFYPPFAFGGDAIYLYRLCSELARRGHEVDVIHCADSFHLFRKDVDPAAFPVSEGIRVHRIESPFGPLAPLAAHQLGGPLLNRGPIEAALNSAPFDVLHFHNISLFGPKILTAPAPAGAVKLYTAHDHWLVCPMSVLWKDRNRVCDKPTCLSCTIKSHRPPQWWRRSSLLERCAEQVDAFLAPSRFCSNMHRERGFTRPLEVLNYFLPRAPELTPSASPHPRPYYLFVGRLEKYKGLQDLLPAFEGPGDYDLLVVGSGGYEPQLRAQAEGMERVRFAGWVSQDDIGPYYKHALAVCAPSVTYETFGLVVIESYARRTPVIARRLGPLPEVIEDGRGGLVFSDQRELRAHLDLLARDEELRERLGRQGFESFEAKWTPDPHIDRYMAIIDRVKSARTS